LQSAYGVGRVLPADLAMTVAILHRANSTDVCTKLLPNTSCASWTGYLAPNQWAYRVRGGLCTQRKRCLPEYKALPVIR